MAYIPKLTSVDVTHKMSVTSVATAKRVIGTFPYLMWKGSIMVKYLLSLIGPAKNRPPN